MKNRLEIAKELLRDDGLIFISIDDREHSYLKILMDEIFGRNNFISDIIIQVNKGGRDYLKIAKTHEFIICYQKSDIAEINEIEKEGLIFRYSDNHGTYNIRELRNRNPRFNKINRPNLYYAFYIDESSIDENGLCNVSLEEENDFTTVTYPLNSQGTESCWRWGKPKSMQNITSDILTTQVVAKQKADGNWNIYEKHRKSKGKIKSVWDDSSVRTEAGTKELGKVIGKDEFAFPKPIELIKRVIQLSTNENDLILDFFGGSGTTAHAVLKLNKEESSNRKFIIIEQMDYINTITCPRVQKALNIEESEENFIYAEIKEIDTFKNNEINKLNKNMQYLPISEIDDEDYNVSEEEKNINKNFYGLENE
jgi:adenine specific DNA methylase Mod